MYYFIALFSLIIMLFYFKYEREMARKRLRSIILPLCSLMYPTLMASKIIAVQPMPEFVKKEEKNDKNRIINKKNRKINKTKE